MQAKVIAKKALRMLVASTVLVPMAVSSAAAAAESTHQPRDRIAVADENLVMRWQTAADDCRGGEPDQVSTYIACADRDAYVQLLLGRKLCIYRRYEDPDVPDPLASAYDWRHCANAPPYGGASAPRYGTGSDISLPTNSLVSRWQLAREDCLGENKRNIANYVACTNRDAYHLVLESRKLCENPPEASAGIEISSTKSEWVPCT